VNPTEQEEHPDQIDEEKSPPSGPPQRPDPLEEPPFDKAYERLLMFEEARDPQEPEDGDSAVEEESPEDAPDQTTGEKKPPSGPPQPPDFSEEASFDMAYERLAQFEDARWPATDKDETADQEGDDTSEEREQADQTNGESSGSSE